MSKNVYEKWDEVKQKSKENNSPVIASYFMGGALAQVYFRVSEDVMGLYIEFPKDVLTHAEFAQIKGMKIDIIDEPKINVDKKYIYIQNESGNEDIFNAFSSSLIDNLSNAKTFYEIYEVCKEVIKEYKDYFSNPNHQLSKQEEQGLCAELITLKELIEVKGEEAVHFWLGPSKNKRDFVFLKDALEIKSTTSQIKTTITISNENQLNQNIPEGLNNLYLKAYIFEDVESGINVLKCIEDINKLLVSAELIREFRFSLLKLKVNAETYKPKYNFSLQYTKCFLVNDKFPKIIKEGIPGEISNVTYKLDISNLEEYKESGKGFYERLQ